MLNNIRTLFYFFNTRKIPPQHLQQMHVDLLVESTPELSYFVLIIGSCIIATLGLLSNSAAVIIGAMLIAPLMSPIRGLAFAALEGNAVLLRKSLIAIISGTLVAIAIAWLLGFLVALPEFGSEVTARSKPNLLDLGIAIAAGSISGYAKIEPKISSTVAGTAIAVALMPPICVIGLGLSHADWPLSIGATILYLTNLLGITLSCMLVFLVTGYTALRRARKALILTLALTTILLLPLGISSIRLIRQAQLEASLKRVLLNQTATFQRTVLISSDVNWLSNPPEVRLNVRSRQPITPKQVRLIEEFIAKKMAQDFTLVFEVGQVEEVRREN